MKGKRVRAGGNVATVQWGPAPLPSQKEDVLWLGLEFDDSVGKHDGTGPDGVRRFECGPSKGSFVKLEKVDQGASFEEILTDKYTKDEPGEMSLDCGRKVELVGRDKALERRKDLSALDIVTLEMERISSCGTLDMRSLRSLALDCNLLSSWDVLYDICTQCPQLQYLSVVSNRLIPEWDAARSALSGIGTLVVRDMGIHEWQWPHHWFPNLEELNLGKNHVGSGSIPADVNFPSLKKLILDDNDIGSWVIVNHAARFPLIDLSLNNTALPDERPSIDIQFPASLDCLSCGDNNFKDWDVLAWLAESLHAGVKDLKAMHNGIADGMGEHSGSTCRQMFVALLPHIVFLNGSKISPLERTNSERMFLSLAMRNADVFLAVDPQSTHRERLEQKHGTGVAGHVDPRQQTNLASQLIKVKLQPDGKHAHKTAVERKLPTTMELRDLKVLCKRLFKMANVRLAFIDPDRPVGAVFPLDDEFREIGFWNISDGCEIRVEEVEL